MAAGGVNGGSVARENLTSEPLDHDRFHLIAHAINVAEKHVYQHHLSLGTVRTLLHMATLMRDFSPGELEYMNNVFGQKDYAKNQYRKMYAGYLEYLANDLRSTPFSIFIDEAWHNQTPVRYFMVKYFSEELGRVVMRHYVSKKDWVYLPSKVVGALSDVFERDGIPWGNLVSTTFLTYTSHEMGMQRGEYFEALVMEKNKHFLGDIGLIYNHLGTCEEKFLSHLNPIFKNMVDSFYEILDMEEQLMYPVRKLTGLEFGVPVKKAMESTWLSMWRTAKTYHSLLNGLTVLLWFWLPEKDRKTYKHVYDEALAKCSENLEDIDELLRWIEEDLMERIMFDSYLKSTSELLYSEREELDLLFTLNDSYLLPLFSSLVEEQEVPVYALHGRVETSVKQFLAHFMREDEVNLLSPDQIQSLDVEALALPAPEIDLGEKTEAVLEKFSSGKQKKFRESIREAFIDSGKYMVKNMPLLSKQLKALSALNPEGIYEGHVQGAILWLVTSMPSIYSQGEAQSVRKEITQLQGDASLRSTIDHLKFEEWWKSVFDSGKYPVLSRLVKTCLSIFTNPHIVKGPSILEAEEGPILPRDRKDRFDPDWFECWWELDEDKLEEYCARLSLLYDLKARKTTDIFGGDCVPSYYRPASNAKSTDEEDHGEEEKTNSHKSPSTKRRSKRKGGTTTPRRSGRNK